MRDVCAVLLLAALLGALAVSVHWSDRAFISRHSAARDLPWSQTARHEQAKGEPLNAILSDSFNLITPDVSYAFREERMGRLPLWNPGILGGVPHLANPMTAVTYPPNLLLVQLPDPLLAILVSAALHLFLGGLFLYLFLRRVGCTAFPALVGALAFALSGWNAAHLHNIQIVAALSWIPLGLFSIEATLRSGLSSRLMPLALALGMSWTAGFPQIALLGTLALAFYGFLGILSVTGRRGARAGLRTAFALLCFAAVGCGIAALQILPTLELKEHSGHQARSEQGLVDHRYRPEALVGLAFPNALGDPMRSDDWQTQLFARIVLGEERPEAQGQIVAPVAMNWSERGIYPGLAILVFALLGVFGAPHRVRAGIVALAALSVALACSPAVIRVVSSIPLMDVGDPSRAIALLALCLPILAAFGLQGGMKAPRAPRLTRPGVISFGLLAVVFGGLAIWGHAEEKGAFEALINQLQDLGLEERFKIPQRLSASAYINDVTLEAFRDLRSDLVRIALFAVGFALMLGLRGRAGGKLSRGLLLVIVVVDLLSVFVPPNLPVTRDGLLETTPGLRFLQEKLGDARILRVSNTGAEARSDAHSLLVPNLGLNFGIQDAQGWREQIPRWNVELWRGVSALVRDVGFAGIPAEAADSPILDLARVRYLVAARPIPALKERQVFPASEAKGELWIYENPDPLPRAWVVHEAISLADEETRARLRDGRLDPRKTVALARWPEEGSRSHWPAGDREAEVSIRESSPDRFVVTVDSPAPGYLVVGDSWFPGWKATRRRDGQEAESLEIVRANSAYRAVSLVSGRQEIEFLYRPRSLMAGGVLSGLSWLFFFLLPLLPSRRRPDPRRREEPRGDGPAIARNPAAADGEASDE